LWATFHWTAHSGKGDDMAGGDGPVEIVWRRQSQWSQAANRLKKEIGRARLAGLWLAMTAAAAGTAAAQLMSVAATLGKSLTFLSAAAAAVAPIAARRAGPHAIRDWTRLRSVSEALKSEVYVMLTGTGPYRHGARGETLLDRVDQVCADGEDLLHHLEDIRPVDRPVPTVSDVPSFITQRVRQQIDRFYRPKAAEIRRRTSLVQRAETVLGALAAVLGATAGAFGVEQPAAWVAVATTVATAVTAHAMASRYEYQLVEYTRTADQLERLLTRREFAARSAAAAAGPGPADDDVFVDECERLISLQNEAWMVRLQAAEQPAGP
jgi:conflict system pore-forming effector with SLATT domain/uncharacterized protein DUF4231